MMKIKKRGFNSVENIAYGIIYIFVSEVIADCVGNAALQNHIESHLHKDCLHYAQLECHMR